MYRVGEFGRRNFVRRRVGRDVEDHGLAGLSATLGGALRARIERPQTLAKFRAKPLIYFGHC
jgi:hypothetical protein